MKQKYQFESKSQQIRMDTDLYQWEALLHGKEDENP